MNLKILVTAPVSVLRAVSCKDSDTVKTMLPIVLTSDGLEHLNSNVPQNM